MSGSGSNRFILLFFHMRIVFEKLSFNEIVRIFHAQISSGGEFCSMAGGFRAGGNSSDGVITAWDAPVGLCRAYQFAAVKHMYRPSLYRLHCIAFLCCKLERSLIAG